MSNNSLKNKRLLILGGNPETGYLVDFANNLGIHTIVIDPNPNSPAKSHANESYDLNVMNISELAKKVRELKLDGILVGVADILVPTYYKICQEFNFPCYATLDSIDSFTTKNGFRNLCEKFEIGVIPYYTIDENLDNISKSNIAFPVLVKPVDNGAGVGMNKSNNLNELRQHIQIALKNSKKKAYIVEKFMDCDDMLVYYTISNGNVYLSAAADRYTDKTQLIGSPVCSLAVYPSKHLDNYKEQVNDKIIKLIKSTGVQNGILNIQFFVEKNIFFAYDPGFRLQGEAPHLYLQQLNKFDSREMLIKFALTGSTQEPNLETKNDPYFKNNFCATLWILLKKGRINQIVGLNDILINKSIFQFVQRLYEGDEISQSMIGTERQVFGRFYIAAKSKKELLKSIYFIQNTLKIFDSNSTDMVLDSLHTNNIII